MKMWVSCELSLDDYIAFRVYLKNHGMKFETSGCEAGVHIEVWADADEISAANDFLDTL